MKKKNKLVHGVGINDYCGSVGILNRTSYDCWVGMLRRCYSARQLVKNPSYIGCTVCDEWLSFNTFKQWYDANYVKGFHLDKDILVECNKVYSPHNCRFIPQYLNKLLTDSKSKRGDLPLGVTLVMTFRQLNPSYRAQCSNGLGDQQSKAFKTVDEASAWYSETKKRIVKEQATRAFLDNAIKTDVYLALIRRNF